MAQTAAIVLNWRRAHDTIACVESLIKLERDLDVVVVDNDSQDGSLDAIRAGIASILKHSTRYTFSERAPPPRTPHAMRNKVTLVQAGRNGGYAAGNNIGIRIAISDLACQYIWILNNDTIVPHGRSLDVLLHKMNSDTTIGICGSTVTYADAPGRIQSRGGGVFDPKSGKCYLLGAHESIDDSADERLVEYKLSYINGAAAFVRRTLFESVGPMSEDYFLYFEEIDWARRANGLFRLGYAADSVVLHKVGSSIGTDDFGNGSALSRYYLTRSRLRFLWRYSRRSLPSAVLDLARDAFRALLRGNINDVLAVAFGAAGLRFRLSNQRNQSPRSLAPNAPTMDRSASSILPEND